MSHKWTKECFYSHVCDECEHDNKDIECFVCEAKFYFSVDDGTHVCQWQEKGKNPDEIEIAGVLCVDHSDD